MIFVIGLSLVMMAKFASAWISDYASPPEVSDEEILSL